MNWPARLRAVAFWTLGLAGGALASRLTAALQQAWGVKPMVAIAEPGAAPLALFLALAIGLVGDFFYYWFHRAQHTIPALWRLHAVHHAIRQMNAVNSYHHWTEELLRIAVVTVPALWLVRLDYTAPIVVAAVFLQGYFLHATTRLHLGPINRLIADNRTHRIHHSLEQRHFGKNYGSFCTVWDQVFRTAYFPKADEWPAVGLSDRPETATVRDYLLATSPASGRANAIGRYS